MQEWLDQYSLPEAQIVLLGNTLANVDHAYLDALERLMYVRSQLRYQQSIVGLM